MDVNAVPAAGRHTQFFIYKFPGSAQIRPASSNSSSRAGSSATAIPLRMLSSSSETGSSPSNPRNEATRPSPAAEAATESGKTASRYAAPVAPADSFPTDGASGPVSANNDCPTAFPDGAGASHPNISAISAPLHTICAFSERISALVPSAQRSPTRPGYRHHLAVVTAGHVGGNERAAPGSRFDDHRPVAQSRDEAVALHETRLIGPGRGRILAD